METYSVLVVEDEKTLLGTWQRDVRDFAAANKVNIELFTAESLEEAKIRLEQGGINFLVADIRIPARIKGATSPVNGNLVLKNMLSYYPICAAVLSGHTDELDESLNTGGIERVKIFTKANNSNQEVLSWLYSKRSLSDLINKTLTKMHASINRHTAELFYNSILPRWKDGVGDAAFLSKVDTVIARQVAAYVSEKVSLPIEDSASHPEEFYFCPPIRSDRLNTGDLVNDNGKTYVVMNPRCDMARACPDTLLLIECSICNLAYTGCGWGAYVLAGSEEKKKEQLSKFLIQNMGLKNHFLPPCDGRGPWLATFERISTRPKADESVLLSGRFASISPQFVPNLVQRFSAYLARIGQPDLDLDESHMAIQRILSPAVR